MLQDELSTISIYIQYFFPNITRSSIQLRSKTFIENIRNYIESHIQSSTFNSITIIIVKQKNKREISLQNKLKSKTIHLQSFKFVSVRFKATPDK